MSAFHKSEFWAVQCRLANPSSLNSIIYKIKTPEVSNGRFIVKYNVLFILNGQKPLSLPESAWLSSVLPHVLVEAVFSPGVWDKHPVGPSSWTTDTCLWYWRRALPLQALGECSPSRATSDLEALTKCRKQMPTWFRFWISSHYTQNQMLNLIDVFILNSHSMNMAWDGHKVFALWFSVVWYSKDVVSL